MDELLTPEETKVALDNMFVPEEFEEWWWGMTKKLLEAQLAKAEPIIRKQERDKVMDIFHDWDEMGKICDGGKTWRAKYHTHHSAGWLGELTIAVRNALKEESNGTD